MTQSVHSDRDAERRRNAMPGQARPIADERDGLVVFLAQMRDQL